MSKTPNPPELQSSMRLTGIAEMIRGSRIADQIDSAGQLIAIDA